MGKARYIGASSMYAWQFCKALYLADLHGWTRFVSMQNHYNLLYREEEREMMGLCAAEGIGVIPWSPLARGRLTRPWDQRAGHRAGRHRRVRQETLCARPKTPTGWSSSASARWRVERGVPPAQIALAWILSKPFVTSPIIGATKPNHLDDAVAALSIKLAPEEIARLEEPYVPHPVAGFS